MIIVIMGVAGAGKTRIGQLLASQLGWPFDDADDYHSPASIAKMRAGVALADEDRDPWLLRLRALIRSRIERGEDAVLACSALKSAYRERLEVDPRRVTFVYLCGSPELLAQRLAARSSHFMPIKLLKSQIAALEEPSQGLRVSVDSPPEVIVRTVRDALGL